MSTTHHLAQANWARRRFPLDDPRMAGFTGRLDEVNALADAAPGFVWRLQTESGNATDVHVFGDEEIVFNLSVWESLEALRAFTYRTRHSELLRDRGQWFETPQRASVVLWWVPAGEHPTAEESERRFERLWREGPAPEAFTFRAPFPAPGAAARR